MKERAGEDNLGVKNGVPKPSRGVDPSATSDGDLHSSSRHLLVSGYTGGEDGIGSVLKSMVSKASRCLGAYCSVLRRGLFSTDRP